jgi:hypothetical protein
MPSNDNHLPRNLTITVERGDGELEELYLTCLMEQGVSEPIVAEIFGSKDEAYDFACALMKANPKAPFKDLTAGGDQ